MNSRICKWLASFAVFFYLIFVVSTATAGKPPKPPKPPKPDPNPVTESNPALAVAGFNTVDIRVMDVDGGNSELIVRKAAPGAPAMPMVWSPDGTRLVWAYGFGNNLQMADSDGSNRQEIFAATEEMRPWLGGSKNLAASGYYCPVGPGNYIYFLGLVTDDPWNWSSETSQEEFYVLDIDSLPAPPVRLTFDESERHSTLAVSPDGQLIAAWTYDASEGISEGRLEIRDACSDGLDVIQSWTPEQLGHNEDFWWYLSIDWSVDDMLAVVGATDAWTSAIYLVELLPDPETVTATKLIAPGLENGEGIKNHLARWSPDGKMMAYSSDDRVYVLDTESGEITFIVNTKSDKDLDWRPTWEANP